MSTNPFVKRACLGVLIYLALSAAGYANNADCLMCHSAKTLGKTEAGKHVSLHVNPKAFQTSLHEKNACTDCHTDLKGQPLKHKPETAPVNCTICHDNAKTIGMYKRGVHGISDVSCASCHPAHTARKAFDPGTCVTCHAGEYAKYMGSSHNRPDGPTCLTCHGGHGIRTKSDPSAPQYPAKIPGLCAKCHDNPQIMAKYDLPTDRLKTYRESYHGVANKHGNLEVATCISCHGVHGVLPSSDPKSNTNKANLPATCGNCHAGMNENAAKGKVHVVISKQEGGLVYHVANSFKWLTIGTMVALIGHICLDLFARVRRKIFK